MRLWLAAAVAAYFLFFFGATRMGLIGPDEPRYASIGHDMARSGDWVTPRLWGQPWFEKPALLYWMTATAFSAGLDEDTAPRLPVALLSVLFLLGFYRRLRVELGNPAAAYATALLATSAGWVAYSHVAVVDLPLSAAFGAAMLGLLAWLDRREQLGLVAFAGFLGIAVLAKGLVGPALAMLILLGWSVRVGVRDLWSVARPIPALVFAAVALPWYALCFARNGLPFIEEFFWKQHFARYAAGALAHNQPVWFFLPVLAIGLLPWTPLVFSIRGSELLRDRKLFFFALWAAVTLVFFSFSRDKLPAYVLPALPALAALGGAALARAEAQEKSLRVLLPLCAATLVLFPAAAALLPQALDAGLSAAIRQASWSAPALVALFAVGAAVATAVACLERTGRRPAAIGIICLAAAAGYASMAYSTFPAIDRAAGSRPLWEKAREHKDEICLGPLPRRLVYGLDYYAGRALPDCSAEPKPYRIEAGPGYQ